MPMSSCPGPFILGTTVPSPHLTEYNTVEWFLDDVDGFTQYLNDTAGINVDDLVKIATFYVTRLGE
jgi:hypothetical protein